MLTISEVSRISNRALARSAFVQFESKIQTTTLPVIRTYIALTVNQTDLLANGYICSSRTMTVSNIAGLALTFTARPA